MTTYVEVKNKEQFDELMQLYKGLGWKWVGGQAAPDLTPYTSFPYGVSFEDSFDWSDHNWETQTIISFEEAKASIEEMMPWEVRYGSMPPLFLPNDYSDCKEVVQKMFTPYNFTNPPKESLMTRATTFFRNLTLSPEAKLLQELGLENPDGTPTEAGYDLSLEITYKANREKIIEIAKQMKEEETKQSK